MKKEQTQIEKVEADGRDTFRRGFPVTYNPFGTMGTGSCTNHKLSSVWEAAWYDEQAKSRRFYHEKN